MINNDKTKNIYQSCNEVEKFHLVILSKIDRTSEWFTPCCNLSIIGPKSKVADDPEESLNNFIELRHNMIEENRRVYQTDDKERIYTNACQYCTSYVVNDWSDNTDKISFMNLSMAPATCQSKCMYCGFIQQDNSITTQSKESYERLFKILEFIKMNNMTEKNVLWQLSSGEITIHPYKKRLLELVDGLNVSFLSNCFVFDFGIADHLRKNPKSTLNLSIDSGRSITWRKVKGVNNFCKVLENLKRYCSYVNQDAVQQITLKYIVMPGINTDIRDYTGVINIMKENKIWNLIISRDTGVSYDISDDKYMNLLTNISDLAYMCKINGFNYDLTYTLFSESEIDRIKKMVDDRLQQI